MCFQRRAPGDVLVKGEKIAGSAQRRCRGAVLQHGSVLLARSPAAPELDGLKELTAQTILVEEFHTGVVGEAFAGHWPSRWQRGEPLRGASPPGRAARRRKVRVGHLDKRSIEGRATRDEEAVGRRLQANSPPTILRPHSTIIQADGYL